MMRMSPELERTVKDCGAPEGFSRACTEEQYRQEVLRLAAENSQLKRALATAEMENKVLKRAAAFFAKSDR
mgnify:CR=1 FL=1